jgi:DNA-binding winged helix-turn-helix (wHTH) protein/TolB-like protein
MTARQLYEFGPFRLDPAERRLLRDGSPVALTPKCFDLLVVLVESAGHLLSKSELMERVWPQQFVEETNLSVNISELRKALGEGQDGAQYVETVRKQGFRFVAPVRTIESAEAVSTTPTVAVRNRRPAIVIAVAAAVVFVVAGAVLWMRRDVAPSRAPIRTIAVLPFKPLVAAARDESLEMGMADTLITRLGAVRAVTVRPLSSVRPYTKLDNDPVAAGRKLDVEAVIDGSIQRAADRIRVTVRLTLVADGSSLWSGTFDERFTDIFDVQDAIAAQVTRSLALRLSAGEAQRLNRRETTSASAYEDYLRGRYSLALRTEEGIRGAIASFRRAVALDPASASAYSGLADSYALLSQYAGVAPDESFPAAKAAAERALALDDTLADAHTSLAFVREAFDWNWNGAEAGYRRALALDPESAVAHHRYGVFLTMMGRFDEGARELEQARRIEPLSVIISADNGMASYLARRYDRAIEQ